MRFVLLAPLASVVLGGCVIVGAAAAPSIASAAAPPAPKSAAAFHANPAAVEAHVRFLADDLMEGREAGSRGFDIAANYVAQRFREYGLKPAGDAGSYLQRVPLISTRAADQGRFDVVDARGQATSLVFGEDYFPSASYTDAELKVDAPLVFVGYGIVAPERGRDDYAGLDVRGKIVVMLSGAPSGFQGEERAHYGRSKYRIASDRGAAGYIVVRTPTSERTSPFTRGIRTWQDKAMTWADADGRPFLRNGTAPALGAISLKGAETLLAGAPVAVADIMAAAEKPEGDVPRFALPSRARVAFRSEIGKAVSANVAGLIEGSDPSLANEVIVLTGHLDHVGIGTPVNGDAIYNGAMDNAAGIATLLEVARGFSEAPVKPKRPILILAVTAEEKGLVGSDYYARNPTVPKGAIAANVNLDMPILTYDFVDVVAFGAERSSIGPAVRRAAESMGLKLTKDPTPEEGLFTRSDHYRFVEQGVPSVFLKTGDLNGGGAITAAFRKERYHQPGDDLTQAFDWSAGAKFADVNYRIARDLADGAERPRWNSGDFFGTLFGK